MAQEIVRWCDVCLGEDQRTTASPVTVSLERLERLVDLCTDHHKEYIEPLASLLTAWGQKVDKPAVLKSQPTLPLAEDDQLVCFLCDREYANTSSFRKHLVSIHEMPDQAALLGDTCPLCGETLQSFVGLRSHCGQTHQMSPLAAFTLSIKTGDEHGVIAARREELG